MTSREVTVQTGCDLFFYALISKKLCQKPQACDVSLRLCRKALHPDLG